jgi:hypothetical protein
LTPPAELIQCLSRLREIFPQPIQMEWSIAEYLMGMKEVAERMLAALGRWKAEKLHWCPWYHFRRGWSDGFWCKLEKLVLWR